MTHATRLPVHSMLPNHEGRRSAHHAPPASRRRPSVRLVSDAVVASYIHDISQRHREGARASDARSRRGPHS